jgi:tripartite-type tricarboxylate transporter receptor subunit TctC
LELDLRAPPGVRVYTRCAETREPSEGGADDCKIRDPARGAGGCVFHRPSDLSGAELPVAADHHYLGRIIAEPIRAALGQPVIVENVTGANGTIGVGRVARAPGDGYTLDVGQLATHVTNGVLYRLPYDLVKDFEPVALVGSIPLVIAAKQNMPASDLTEFISWLKANPNKASQGVAGVGSTTHIYGVLFQKATGTRFQFIPYRGVAPAVQDLVAGNIEMAIADPISALPQVQARTIKAYAVTASSRLSIMPDIPTVDEAGCRDFT